MDSDDYDLEKIDVFIPSSLPPGIYNVSVNVEYEDTFGMHYSQKYPVEVKVSPKVEEEKDFTLLFFLALTLILLFFLLRRFFKKGKR